MKKITIYIIALMIVLMCILLTTGCTTKPVLDNQTVNFHISYSSPDNTTI